MWAIISTSNQLIFYDLKSNDQGMEIDGLSYFIKEKGHVPEISFAHDCAAKKLLLSDIPLFISKSDARKEAVKVSLTGFKYLKLSPSIIKLT